MRSLKRSMAKAAAKTAAVAGAFVLGASALSAQIMTGTNATAIMSDNLNNTSAAIWPWVVGLIGACTAIGVFYRISGKGKVRV